MSHNLSSRDGAEARGDVHHLSTERGMFGNPVLLHDSAPQSPAKRFASGFSAPHFEQRIFPRSGYTLNSLNSALASFRSAVSKPSVNQP
jgi:hypothetical protein